MQRTILIAATAVLMSLNGRSQGLFNYSTLGYAPTHIGSIDGPLAGTSIWAQMLAGPTPAALAPVGPSVHHIDTFGVPAGFVNAGVYPVPGIPDGQTAFFEMLVWDGTRWGTALSGVPGDQLGMTDVVPLVLAGLFGFPAGSPPFMRSAIVPVPEPTTLAIGLVAAAGILLRWAVRRRLGPRSRSMALRREG